MKYAVDKIIDNIATLENVETGEIIDVDISELPEYVKETDMLVLEDGIYKKDEQLKKSRLDLIREKMERLKNGN